VLPNGYQNFATTFLSQYATAWLSYLTQMSGSGHQERMQRKKLYQIDTEEYAAADLSQYSKS
jgi:hypothetical protein